MSNSSPLLSYALIRFKNFGSNSLSKGENSDFQPTLNADFVTYVLPL